MAGLWSAWRDPAVADSTLLSCTVLTTDAVGELTHIHDRMPLIMPERDWASWLDPDRPPPATLLERPGPEVVAGLELRRVSDRVNSVKNNGSELVAAVDHAHSEVGEQIRLL